MEIQPQSNIKLLHNVPLDTSYDHTIYFATASDQYNYFAGLTKYSLTNQTYQRVNKGKARVAFTADDIYDCNYMMFQNTAFGNKWFYAYINSIEYVNNETSEITFEIDPMQTWWFDFTIDQCFVEREHPVTDAKYEHLVPENLELGDYEIIMSNAYDMNNQGIAMLATLDYNLQPPSQGNVMDNVYTPLFVGVTTEVSRTAGDNLVQGYVQAGKEDAIVSMYQFPLKFGMAGVHYESFSINEQNNVGGYIPKNNKLFSYPFSMVVLTNFNGETAELRWEQWASGHRGECEVAGTGMGEPCAFCYPKNYRGVGAVGDYDSGITYKGFPAIPFGGDAFKAFWAQNKTKLAISAALGAGGAGVAAGLVATGVIAATSGIALGAVGAGIAAVAGVLGKMTDTKNVPPQAHGSISNDYLNAGMNKNYFQLQAVSIRAPFARVIDDYFTKFGYATHRVKTPNINSRPHWNYVKTISATITGSIPADDAKKICQLLDNGITFWKNGNEIGNYSLDNRPS